MIPKRTPEKLTREDIEHILASQIPPLPSELRKEGKYAEALIAEQRILDEARKDVYGRHYVPPVTEEAEGRA